MKLLGAAALVVVQVGLVLLSASTNVNGYLVAAPAAFAGLLVTQARMATLELHPEERIGVIAIRRFGFVKRTSFAYADLRKSEVVRAIFMGSPADYELRLGLAGNRSVSLLRGSHAELTSERAALDAFLDGNALPEREA